LTLAQVVSRRVAGMQHHCRLACAHFLFPSRSFRICISPTCTVHTYRIHLDIYICYMPRPTNQSTDRARDTRARPIQPRVSRPSPHEPKRPRESQPTPRTPTHVTQLFSVLAQLFDATVSHFLVLLSYLVIVNSVIFGIVNSVISIYNKLSYFSYRAQLFYDFISHTTTVNSVILLEKSAIFATMN
jgi:hypothetical protein